MRVDAFDFLAAWHLAEQVEPWRFPQYSRFYFACRARMVDGVAQKKLGDVDWAERMGAGQRIYRDYFTRNDVIRAEAQLRAYLD
jgi:hypothetical protein